MNKHHILVIDPIAFPGGSKVATKTLLNLLNPEKNRITVMTSDADSWQSSNITTRPFYQPHWLASQEQGLLYLINHCYIALAIVFTMCRVGYAHSVVGASGPGVDLALYLLKPLLKYRLIQLVHGPVAASRIIGRCLLKADRVFFLESTHHSLIAALNRVKPTCVLPDSFNEFCNGLPAKQWPSKSHATQTTLFWAASLLKWKGLDIFLSALEKLDHASRPETHICFIKPQKTTLSTHSGPITMPKVSWHEQPKNIDAIRAGSTIFISTSDREPFGLSILEAMAAGLCVFIPDDGAYWSQVLIDGENCVKYSPADADDLAKKLQTMILNQHQISAIGAQSKKIAEQYRAEKQLKPICDYLEQYPFQDSIRCITS